MKRFKIVFLLLLIFTLTMASYGQVAVSDGSAFLTKAEFNRNLSNMSSRMTYLENSLDSKIDTLVASYLSRNGIWNGTVQENALSSTIMSVGFNGQTTATAYHYFYYDYYTDGSQIGNSKIFINTHSDNYYDPVAIGENNTERTLIANVSKSGLLCLTFDKQLSQLNNDFNSTLNLIQVAAHSNARIIGDQVRFSIIAEFNIIEYEEGSSTGNTIYTDFSITQPAIPGRVSFFRVLNNSAYMFVNKGSRVTAKLTNRSTVNKVGILYGSYGYVSAVYRYRVNSLTVY